MCHCEKTPDKTAQKKRGFFWLMVGGSSAHHGWRGGVQSIMAGGQGRAAHGIAAGVCGKGIHIFCTRMSEKGSRQG